jgi:hypothetical protein
MKTTDKPMSEAKRVGIPGRLPSSYNMPESLKELLYIKQWGDKYGWDTVKGLIEARIAALKRFE